MSQDSRKFRFILLRASLVLLALVFIFNLAKLQLFDPYYINKASATTLNQKTVYPARGLFYDRNAKLLVINYPAYDLYTTYKEIKPGMDTQKLCTLLNIDQETFKLNLEKDWSSNKYSKSVPFVFLKNLDSRTLLTFQENLYQFPGFYPTLRAVRKYPEPYGAHYLGYISEVNKRDIDQSEGLYKLGDYIGVTGLEKQYEEYLKGESIPKYLSPRALKLH